jgi:pyruvate/2-oxoglutarate dehydrogenase complex dihydrolipoamide dehydrogenase (E3) component
LYNKDTGEILGVHIIGMHAADLIQECANAMAAGSTVKEMAMMVKKITASSVASHFTSSLCRHIPIQH